MPVKATTTRAERALRTLRQEILSGTRPGGTRLFEVALAEELSISRTPVRAALARLGEEGLLDRAKGGGFVVRSFKLADVMDTIELRGVLEGTAARFAAERGASADDLAEAQEIISSIDAAIWGNSVDMDAYSRLNARFHSLLVAMSRSDALRREIARVTALPFASPSAFLEDDSRIQQLERNVRAAHEQHRAIIEAIALRHGARAESVTREHARAALRNVRDLTGAGADRADGVLPLALLSS